jgi:hypothetical protein
MSTAMAAHLMTTEQLLGFPNDGVERELSRGRLKQREMTRRGRRHTKAGAVFSRFLCNWLATQPEPHGEVLVGEAGFQLRHDPGTTVGID